jgi:hypothetical protein
MRQEPENMAAIINLSFGDLIFDRRNYDCWLPLFLLGYIRNAANTDAGLSVALNIPLSQIVTAREQISRGFNAFGHKDAFQYPFRPDAWRVDPPEVDVSGLWETPVASIEAFDETIPCVPETVEDQGTTCTVATVSSPAKSRTLVQREKPGPVEKGAVIGRVASPAEYPRIRVSDDNIRGEEAEKSRLDPVSGDPQGNTALPNPWSGQVLEGLAMGWGVCGFLVMRTEQEFRMLGELATRRGQQRAQMCRELVTKALSSY